MKYVLILGLLASFQLLLITLSPQNMFVWACFGWNLGILFVVLLSLFNERE